MQKWLLEREIHQFQYLSLKKPLDMVLETDPQHQWKESLVTIIKGNPYF